ncbi:winged helix-turn-helix domain-containing protein [Streptomyces niveus]
MTRVLVVEDEPQLVRALEINLKARKYEVESASDGGTGLRLAAEEVSIVSTVGQKQLLHEVWGTSHNKQTNYLRVCMAQLRRKLQADPAHPRHLITSPGMGYRFET